MRHLHFVSKAPQAAITDISSALQALMVLLELLGNVRGIIATVEAKKGDSN